LMTTARAEHPVAFSAIAEFIQAYKQAREDSDDGIRESAAFIATLTGDPLSLKKCLADIAVILEQCLFLPRYSRCVLQEAG
ncbi:hypothetical protein KU710_22570, partial [Salmonella enterica subsp. enterica serovar Give]|nr:hypothetical protein [Salmonella enterica subsp. enterica serovar Give]